MPIIEGMFDVYSAYLLVIQVRENSTEGLVKVKAEALAWMHVGGSQSDSRSQMLRNDLTRIVRIVERKIDEGELPVVYLRDVTTK